MSGSRAEHPSGRPIRREKTGIQSIVRIPYGPVTPRLREDNNTTAIGFIHRFACDEETNDG